MKHPLTVATALLLTAAAIAGCGGDDTDQGSYGSIDSGSQYVALGDSYTAAPNTGPNVGNNGCYNTKVNYPHQIAEATGAELVDNSCNGANSTFLTTPQRTPFGERPPQLDDIDAETDLVTIRMGANDYQLFFRIIRCAMDVGADAAGAPCTDADAAGGANSLEPRLADLEANLVRALEEIGDRAPDAQVFVISYPRLVPDDGTCAELPVPEGDYDYVRRIIEGLNTALSAAAAATDTTFVDMYAASEGHDICADDPWVAGAGVSPRDAAAWHPYPEEGETVADLVLAALRVVVGSPASQRCQSQIEVSWVSSRSCWCCVDAGSASSWCSWSASAPTSASR